MYDDLEEDIDFLDEDLDEDLDDDFYDDSELFDVDDHYYDDNYDDDDFNAYYEVESLDDEVFDVDEGDSLSRRQRRARRRSRRRRILSRAKRLALKLAKAAKANAGKIGAAVGAFGGPGGAAQGAQIGNAIQNLEDDDWEGEEWEDESDTEEEMNAVMPMSALDDSLAEAMASAAAKSKPSDAQALGGAIAITITSRAPMAVKKIAPAMACATGRIAKQMAADPPSRPLINVLPTIVKDTAATLTKKAEKGKPITKRTAARVMNKQAKRTLRSQSKLAQALTNNALKKQKLNKAAIARAERFY